MLLSFVCLMLFCPQIFLEVCAANVFYTFDVIRMKPKCRCARQIDWSNNHLYPLELNFCASHRFNIAYVMKIKIYICEKHRDLMCKPFLSRWSKHYTGMTFWTQPYTCTLVYMYVGIQWYTIVYGSSTFVSIHFDMDAVAGCVHPVLEYLAYI